MRTDENASFTSAEKQKKETQEEITEALITGLGQIRQQFYQSLANQKQQNLINALGRYIDLLILRGTTTLAAEAKGISILAPSPVNELARAMHQALDAQDEKHADSFSLIENQASTV